MKHILSRERFILRGLARSSDKLGPDTIVHQLEALIAAGGESLFLDPFETILICILVRGDCRSRFEGWPSKRVSRERVERLDGARYAS